MSSNRNISKKFGNRLLRRFLEKEEFQEKSGDIEEAYNHIAREKNKFKAVIWKINQIIKILVSLFYRSIYWSFIMLKNYMKVTFRNVRKHKVFSFINISGLSVGIACAIMILLWVRYELSYDKFHKNADRIYRVIGSYRDREIQDPYMPGPLGEHLKNNYPDIEDYTLYKSWDKKIVFEKRSFICTGSYVNPAFFEFFSFPFSKGNPEIVFNHPNSIVITEELSQKLFGSEDPIGKILQYFPWGDGMDLTVTGVIKNVPDNSHIQFDFLVPAEIIPEFGRVWTNKSPHIYVLLSENSNHKDVSEKISGVLDETRPELNYSVYLQPLKEIHLYHLTKEGRKITYVIIFSVMAVIILLVACINFMNLSTARSSIRFKEIGIKKAVGSRRRQLIYQFLSESVILTFIALILGLILVFLLVPNVNRLLGSNLKLDFTPGFIFYILLITIFTGLVSGSYPAFYLSSFDTVSILRQQMTIFSLSGRKKLNVFFRRSILRKTLVVFQFTFSIVFIISAVFIYNQLNFMRKKDLGYNQDNILMVKMEGGLRNHYLNVKNGLLQDPNILNVTCSGFSLIKWEASDIEKKIDNQNVRFEMGIGVNLVDFDFLETFGLSLIQGRFFSRKFPVDLNGAAVLNESTVKVMGIENPIGKKITWADYQFPIVGVVKDFHTESLHREIRPYFLLLQNGGSYMYIKINGKNIPGTIGFIESKIKEIVPDDPLIYSFLGDMLNNSYLSEKRMSNLAVHITLLAIFISLLGLFGLASFSTERRIKEIGIRKILGASVSNIVGLLSKEFLVLILFANIIAWPAAYYIMRKWLDGFAYKTSLGINVFFFAGLLTIIISILTISWQSMKAASSNPVNSIRIE